MNQKKSVKKMDVWIEILQFITKELGYKSVFKQPTHDFRGLFAF